MSDRVILLSIPGLRQQDLASMPNLTALVQGGDRATLVPSFPCVTCPVQVNMTTGKPPREHGVVANGFYWRDKQQVEMWTAWNQVIERPQIWDTLRKHQPQRNVGRLVSAAEQRVRRRLHLHAGADPQPRRFRIAVVLHQADGTLRRIPRRAGAFSAQALLGSAGEHSKHGLDRRFGRACAGQFQPDFFYIYLPHLDYAAQKTGPDSEQARQALADLDNVLGRLRDGIAKAYSDAEPLWLVASEYTIVPVDHVEYPNRVLREAGLLAVQSQADGEHLDFAASRAFAMVDHQFSHVFVQQPADSWASCRSVSPPRRNCRSAGRTTTGPSTNSTMREPVKSCWYRRPTVGKPITIGSTMRGRRGFARTVDIHRKPGYDPVELHFDPATRSIPLNAMLVKGSHGAPATDDRQRGIILSSQPGVIVGRSLADTDVHDLVLGQFAV